MSEKKFEEQMTNRIKTRFILKIQIFWRKYYRKLKTLKIISKNKILKQYRLYTFRKFIPLRIHKMVANVIKIQSSFRGYTVRKTIKTLRGLLKGFRGICKLFYDKRKLQAMDYLLNYAELRKKLQKRVLAVLKYGKIQDIPSLKIKKSNLHQIAKDEGKYKMAEIFRSKYIGTKIFYKWLIATAFKEM